jgi:hypothetical protein
MEIATYLLLAIGILGAADIALFHTVANGIRAHADSRWELYVHSLRGPTYGSLFLLIPNVQMHGAWFWALLALFALDVAISLWDFALEKASRATFGGLPTGEYILHIVIAMFFGGLVAVVSLQCGAWANLPTNLQFAPAAVPVMVRILLAVMALVVFWTELGDLRAAIRHSRRLAAAATDVSQPA